jgi:hypothetical protein
VTRRAWPVHSTAVESVWHQALPFVERALAHDNGRMSAADHLARLVAADQQLWLGASDGRLEMLAITEITVWPRMKVARFALLAGEDFDGWWAETRPMFEAWARREGCRQFEVGGRMAWLRKLKGWSLDAVVMRTEVGDA